MKFHQRHLYASATMLYLTILTFTTGQEGHNVTQQPAVSNGTQKSIKEGLPNGKGSLPQYDWLPNINEEDYGDSDVSTTHLPVPGVSANVEISANTTAGAKESTTEVINTVAVGNVKGNLTEISSSSSASVSPISSTTLKTSDLTTNVTDSNELGSSSSTVLRGSEIASSLQPSSSTSSTTEQTQTATGQLTAIDSSTTENLNSTTLSSTTTSEMKTTPSPIVIVTEDLENTSNYTSTPVPDLRINSGGLRTWAVVVTSVLISFAVIFTILYIIRGAMIRRRKADQRRLLRGSISSEGYFYGDDADTGGKFEL